MRAVKAVMMGVSIAAIAVVVYAGDGFGVKCKEKSCGFEAPVTFGGGMVYEQLTGYCRACKKFVHLRWTREGGPVLDPKAAKVPPPKALGEVVDVRTGGVLVIYACPHCKGPFAEIKSKDDLKHCPVCAKSGFGLDDTKPMMAID